jgi:hypothetical protein
MNKNHMIIAIIAAAALIGAFYLQRPGDERSTEELGPQAEESEPPQTGEPGPPQDESPGESVPLKTRGVSLSPKDYVSEAFADFFVRAEHTGGIVTWAGDWGQLTDEAGAPYVVTELALSYELEPIVLATYFDQSTGESSMTLDESTRSRYIDGAVGYVDTYRPRYMGFGIEVNSFQMRNQEGYEEFVEFFGEVYEAMNEASPETRVFTVFQLERMKGLWGGLFGETNNPDLAQWNLLEDFEMADAFAFTTYPCLIYDEPSEMPDDYYDEIREHTMKEVLFTEIGWFREGPEGWESSETEQADFIRTFFDLTSGIEPSLSIWSFMYDQKAQYPFDSMGLMDVNEAHVEAWEDWTSQK